ncbi:MAG: NusG domain II-containing protein [Treponema sp.]|nr:NusG domain II-containing protein [Treponema sp.]
MLRKIKIPDILIIMLAAIITFYSAYLAYIKPRGQTYILIQAEEGKWVYPVNAHETVTVNGVIGDTVIKIEDSRAWIESSPCDNKTCIAAGKISRQGEWAACLPNNVLLLLYGSAEIKDDNIDSIAW